jgi:hypothetical protein
MTFHASTDKWLATKASPGVSLRPAKFGPMTLAEIKPPS